MTKNGIYISDNGICIPAHIRLLADKEMRQSVTLPVRCSETGAPGVVLGSCGFLADEDGVSCFFPDIDGKGRWPVDDLLLDLREEQVIDRVSRVMWGVSGVRFGKRNGWVLAADRYKAMPLDQGFRGGSDLMHVPELATIGDLPETDRLPTAVRMCWVRWLRSNP